MVHNAQNKCMRSFGSACSLDENISHVAKIAKLSLDLYYFHSIDPNQHI